NDATRLLGSTLGVAVIGSVYASLFARRLTSSLPAALPRGLAHTAHNSVGAALEVAHGTTLAGHPAVGLQVHSAASSAFFDGLSAGCLVAAGVSAAGALLAAALLPAQPTEPAVEIGRPLAATAAVDRRAWLAQRTGMAYDEHVVAGPADEQVVVATAVEAVVTGAAVEAVLLRSAAQDVIARASVEDIGAVAAAEHVVAEAAEQAVGATLAEDPVVAASAVDLVAGGRADQRVRSARALHDHAAGSGPRLVGIRYGSRLVGRFGCWAAAPDLERPGVARCSLRTGCS